MDYTTEFRGSFQLDKPLDPTTAALINGLCRIRRMKRDLTKLGMSQTEADRYGIDGEFFVSDNGINNDASILDYNLPPSTQPSRWLHWHYNDQQQCIQWDSNENFYGYVEWLEYLIAKILAPNYVLNGTVTYQGDDFEDRGFIAVQDNKVNFVYHDRNS